MRIACLPGFATSHLPSVLSKFLAQRPGVTVTLEPDRTERIQEWVIGQQYDCGITDAFTGYGISLKTWIEVRQFSTACKLVQEGQGAAIISALDAEQYRDKGIIIRAFTPKLTHRVSLIWRKKGPPSQLAKDFLSTFQDSLTPFVQEG